MYVAIVDDAPAGPPSVMIQTMSKSWIEPMIARKAEIRIVGPSSGSVTNRSVSQLDAPSIAAASCSSRGTPWSPARKQEDREADVLPGDHDEERVEDEPRSASQSWTSAAEPDRLRAPVDEAVGLEDLAGRSTAVIASERTYGAKKISAQERSARAAGG